MTFSPLTSTPPCSTRRRASFLEGASLHLTIRSSRPMESPWASSRHRQVQGISAVSPPPPKMARAADWAFSASSWPWTSLVSS